NKASRTTPPRAASRNGVSSCAGCGGSSPREATRWIWSLKHEQNEPPRRRERQEEIVLLALSASWRFAAVAPSAHDSRVVAQHVPAARLPHSKSNRRRDQRPTSPA